MHIISSHRKNIFTFSCTQSQNLFHIYSDPFSYPPESVPAYFQNPPLVFVHYLHFIFYSSFLLVLFDGSWYSMNMVKMPLRFMIF